MGVENDSNTRVTRVFRQVQTSVRIIIIHPMLLCIMICWIETPSTLILYARRVGFTRKIRISYNFTRPRLDLYLSILQDLSIEYLLNRLGNGPPDPDVQAEWTDSWWAPFHSLRVQSVWYPWYQISLAVPECLASELRS
jgi:hypothetical protein